jgi:hypothetical protein
MAAQPLAAPELAELSRRGAEAGAPALVTARFQRGTLEPRRPPGAERRVSGPGS